MNTHPIIYVFGNPLLSQDASPVHLLSPLRKQFPDVHFKHVDPTENWWEGDSDVVIIDTVEGIRQVTLFSSLAEFQQTHSVTPHDYDVYFDISLLMKIKKIRHITIIGIPHSNNYSNTGK